MRAILLTPKKDYGEVSSSRAVDPVEDCHCLCYEGPIILVTVHDTMVRYPDTSGLREKERSTQSLSIIPTTHSYPHLLPDPPPHLFEESTLQQTSWSSGFCNPPPTSHGACRALYMQGAL